MALHLHKKPDASLLKNARTEALDTFIQFFFTFDAGEEVYVFHSATGAVTKGFMEAALAYIAETGKIPTLADLDY